MDFNSFLLKVKASLIELLWNDKNNNNIPFLNEILNNYPEEINDEFFPINRKCRDNIHYGFYNELTEDEINFLNKYQDIYLRYIINKFEKKINN